MKESEDEHVATAHSSTIDGVEDTLPMHPVHGNCTVTVPFGRQVKQIKGLVYIAHKTRQN